MRTISIVNQSTIVSDADFRGAVAACQQQVDEHFGPAWGGVSCQLVMVSAAPGVPQPAAGAEVIYILDDADQQGALGYHQISQQDVPVGYVFAKTSRDAGDAWQTTLSHELLEQLIDPYCNTFAQVSLAAGIAGRSVPAIVGYEVADPVENDSYLIDGVPVSNFVLPAWFQEPGETVKGPFDYLGKLTAPVTMTAGGYFSYSTNLRRWHQASARTAIKPDKYHRPGKQRRAA